ncbi:4'-phosphopantetheinyl transferase family protein [Methylobacterium sp. E-045]|uniref:4'-phosphopantetheinyl transferase family protein n=1 Tax=Methylobacterium sp. E-045 TaxID=2836575 RepID=UPI001FB8CE37|nr:4'-phosphopantetheinyl transferase superfamily protein [Methylobacterium sp. E-045]MCJ2132428.1 4'-phosphopantetheinyl transferase superfamily protein [Methylobacterium sp. E-045]
MSAACPEEPRAGETPDRTGPGAPVTVWDVDLTQAIDHRATCRDLLSDDERARASRFVRDVDRWRFEASHAALRLVLGLRCGSDPRALVFGATPSGKPHLVGEQAGSCRFSLSHSGSRALIGLSSSAEIGVDVEEMRPMPDLLRIAQAHFAPREIAALETLAPRDLTVAFFACWTRKEAVAKATGQGLSLRLDSFAVSVTPERAELLAIPEGTAAWSLHALPTAPDHLAAIAIMAADTGFLRRTLPPDWAAGLSTISQRGP